MKVRDLIRELKRFPPNAEIRIDKREDFEICAVAWDYKYAGLLSIKKYYPIRINLTSEK